jgi:nucleoside-diphosphate-sugar epimerase
VDAKEFARVVLDLLPHCHRDILNVGPGCGKSIRELAMTISQAAGFKGEVRFNPTAYVGIKEKFIDAGKLRKSYSLQVSDALAPGIGRTVKWLSANFADWKDRQKFA